MADERFLEAGRTRLLLQTVAGHAHHISQIPEGTGSGTGAGVRRADMIAFEDPADPKRRPERNVLGGPLSACSREPLTGFFRDGCCRTGPDDAGSHTVCAVMTAEFLEFTVRAGNDLVTPQPQWDFPGLLAGDRWCLCAARWLEAARAGAAPPVILEATHERSLSIVPLDVLKRHAFRAV